MGMIQTVDNYFKFPNREDSENYYFKCDKLKASQKKIIGEKLEITLSNFKADKNNTILPIFQSKDKKDDELIISITKNGDDYIGQTGNFIGKFLYRGIEIDISSRFSDAFLNRMLNFANDVYLDDVSIFEAKDSKDFDYSKYVIYYMFIQKLEKAFLLGLPKAYNSINHHDMKLRGKIDINRFIKNDIPFRGKISSVSREQKEIQEIIDILHKAISIIEKNSFSTKNISHIKAHLKQNKSNQFVSNQTISQALKSKALKNPIFTPYKKVIEYARFIINADNLEEKKDANKQTFGFLIDVSELFELYLYKLLKKEFSDWEVIHEEQLRVYTSAFYKRNMYPDIVMKKDNDLLVFDAKYKKMNFRGSDNLGMGDLDRGDFYQIHTYMSYYQNEGNLLSGGLLYPIDEPFYKDKCISDNWLGGKGKFIVDGIDLSGLIGIENEIKELIEKIEELNKDKKKNKKDIEKNREAIEEKRKNLSELLIKEEENFIKRIKD